MKGIDTMKRTLSLLLVAVMCLGIFATVPSIKAEAVSSHLYMIGTFPGEDCNTSMNIGWHSDYTYTNCYVEYTLKSDAGFSNSMTATGTYDSDDYLWFYDRIVGYSADGRTCTTKFLNWGLTLENLTPDTDYIYRIWDGEGACSEVHHFKTSGAENFSILWLGDDHVFSSETHRVQSWAAMYEHLKTLAAYDIGFQLSTGDTVTSGDRYGDWLTVYEQNFAKEMMLANTPGNHDSYDDVMLADPNYTQYWKSSMYFKITNNVPQNAFVHKNSRIKAYLSKDGLSQYEDRGADEVIYYDPANPGLYCSGAVEDTNGMHYWFKYNNCLFIMFDFWSCYYSTADMKTAQEWAGKVIEANKGTYDYLICANHNNYINGHSGTDRSDTDGGATGYRKTWMPFADKYNVDILLSGDNHIYVRTSSLYNNALNDDPTKGTYIIQGPCLSRGQTNVFVEGDPIGFIDFQYSNGASTVGGVVMDVTNDGITFTLACEEEGVYRTVDTYTVPKKPREKNIETGYYTATSALTVRETKGDTALALTTVPAGTIVEVVKADGHWGLMRYNGYTGWALIEGNANFEAEANTPASLVTYAVNAVDVPYQDSAMAAFTPAYGSTIYTSGWSYTYACTLTAVRDDTGLYKVTSINTATEDKSATPIPENGVVFLFNNTYNSSKSFTAKFPVGTYLTFDYNGYAIYPVNVGEENPVIKIGQKVTPSTDSGYTVFNGLLTGTKTGTSASEFLANFTNASNAIKVFDANGTELASDATVGTNCTVVSYADDTAYDTVTVIIKGDCTGDGLSTVNDALAVKQSIKNIAVLEGNYIKAVDSDNNGKLSTLDYIKIKLAIKG